MVVATSGMWLLVAQKYLATIKNPTVHYYATIFGE